MGLRGVPDDLQSVTASEARKGSDIGRHPVKVDWRERPRPPRDAPLGVPRIEREGARVNVREDRPGRGGNRHRSRGHKRKVRDDDFIAGPKKGFKRQEQRRRAGAHRHGVSRAYGVGESPLELLRYRAHAPMTAAYDAAHGLDFTAVEIDLGNRNQSLGLDLPLSSSPAETATADDFLTLSAGIPHGSTSL